MRGDLWGQLITQVGKLSPGKWHGGGRNAGLQGRRDLSGSSKGSSPKSQLTWNWVSWTVTHHHSPVWTTGRGLGADVIALCYLSCLLILPAVGCPLRSGTGQNPPDQCGGPSCILRLTSSNQPQGRVGGKVQRQTVALQGPFH